MLYYQMWEVILQKRSWWYLMGLRTHHSLSLYWRTQAQQIGEGKGCPWVCNTYKTFDQLESLRKAKHRYQITCNWSLSSVVIDLFSMNFQTYSNSSIAPDSKPWESWKIKLLPGYVIWCSISCMPLWNFVVYHKDLYCLTYLNWWHQMCCRGYQWIT